MKQETLLIGWNLFWRVNKGWISGVECIGLEDRQSLLWPKCEHFDWINFLGKLQLCHFFEDVKIGPFKDVLEVVLRPANKNNLNFTKWSYKQWGSEIPKVFLVSHRRNTPSCNLLCVLTIFWVSYIESLLHFSEKTFHLYLNGQSRQVDGKFWIIETSSVCQCSSIKVGSEIGTKTCRFWIAK